MALAIEHDDPEVLERAPDALLEAAERLDTRANELVAEARKYRQMAADFRLEAQRQTRAKARVLIGVSRPRETRKVRLEEVEAMLAVLEQIQPAKLGDLADHLGASESVTRLRLNRALELNLVERQGAGKLTKYVVVPATDEPEQVTVEKSATSKLRDAAVELGAFTMAELTEKAGVSRGWADKWAKRAMEKGALVRELVDGSYIYEYTPPESRPVPRPRHTPVEMAVVDRRASLTPEGVGGRKVRIRGAAARQLRDELAKLGASFEQGSSHIKVWYNGQVVGTLNRDMSWDGDVKAAREQMIGNGVPLAA